MVAVLPYKVIEPLPLRLAARLIGPVEPRTTLLPFTLRLPARLKVLPLAVVPLQISSFSTVKLGTLIVVVPDEPQKKMPPFPRNELPANVKGVVVLGVIKL